LRFGVFVERIHALVNRRTDAKVSPSISREPAQRMEPSGNFTILPTRGPC
jgi:hypothetical protein